MGNVVSRIKAIILYCDSIEEKIDRFGREIEDFVDDPDYQHGCSFCVFQIGECIKSLISGAEQKISGDTTERILWNERYHRPWLSQNRS
ncbi:MAG: hypothetical protein LBG63_02915 [Candidatus Methanoplasma sp.]|jgi:hypothetical protein|nr:hypothetical protein [Candidatus Methanoplasma sp.]